MALRTRLCGAAAGDDEAEDRPAAEHLRGPQFIVTDLLKAEGFTDIKYVKVTIAGTSKALASGEVDVSMHFVGPLVIELDAGAPITVLGGVHVGCFELFGSDRVRTIRDLKGKTVSWRMVLSPFISQMPCPVATPWLPLIPCALPDRWTPIAASHCE
jgi:hypothetical protein